MPEHKVSWSLVTFVAIGAAILGAGVTVLLANISPSTFTVFRGALQNASSTTTQPSSATSSGEANQSAAQPFKLEAGCTTTGLVLQNAETGGSLKFDAYSTMHTDEGGEYFVIAKRAQNFNLEDADALFDGVDEGNIDAKLGASIEKVATDIRNKCNIDTLYFDDRFFDSFLEIEEPDEFAQVGTDVAASASLLAASTGAQWREDPSGSYDKCMSEATSATQRAICIAKKAYYKTTNWLRDFFGGFRDFFRGKEGNDGGGRSGPPGGGNGGGGNEPYQCSDWGSQKSCSRNGCTWVEDPKSPSGGFCID